MRGSPAEAGGWRPGDLICSIDGQAIGTDYQGSALAGWTVDTPGRNVRIGLCNGEARHLTLRQFY
jgi:C-terminal processing protease CtpA/Prc